MSVGVALTKDLHHRLVEFGLVLLSQIQLSIEILTKGTPGAACPLHTPDGIAVAVLDAIVSIILSLISIREPEQGAIAVRASKGLREAGTIRGSPQPALSLTDSITFKVEVSSLGELLRRCLLGGR